MSQSKQPSRKPSGTGPSRPPQSTRSQRGPSRPLPTGSPSSSRAAQRKAAPPPPPEPRPLYIWFAAALVPLAILLAWVLWTKGGAVGSLPAGSARYMVIETDRGRIVARLYTAEEADVPATVDHFEQMANSGAFNGRIFHRVEDWVIQGGDPNGDGTGGGEMPARYNQLPFKAGSLGVARGPDPSMNNDSQFFIVKIGAVG